jgi:hypothetical protein
VVVIDARLLVMPRTKRKQSPPGGVADGSTVGGVGCSRFMHYARDVASASMVMHPNVDTSHVVSAKRWLGPTVSDVHRIHSVSQLQRGVPKQPGEVARCRLR